jgi:hypothetical protein
MVRRGEVAVAGRKGRDRLWDLAERVYPANPVVPAGEAQRIRDERRLRALGIARARGPECPVEPQGVGEAGEPAVVEGVRGTWWVDPAQLGQPFSGRAALLSPFDRLAYDRKRMAEIFEFDYQLEIRLSADRFADRRAARRYLLTGRVYCSKCGSSLNGERRRDQPGRPLRPVYHCRVKGDTQRKRGCGGVTINASALDWYIRESVFNHLVPEQVADLLRDDEPSKAAALGAVSWAKPGVVDVALLWDGPV